MKTVTFTEFRKNASGFFSEVENGETILILRHGKAIAEILPPTQSGLKMVSWNKGFLLLQPASYKHVLSIHNP